MDAEKIRQAFYAGFNLAKSNPTIRRSVGWSMYLLTDRHPPKLEEIPWEVAAKDCESSKARIFYKTSDCTMVLRGLGDGRFGFIALERDDRTSTFISRYPRVCIHRAATETLNNDVQRQLYWSNASLQEILSFKP